MKIKEPTRIFNALADPTRLRILNLLAEGELCVCDIMSILKAPQSRVSRHLAYLRRAGLADARKEGLWMYYRLSQPGTKMLRAVFEALRLGRSEIEEFGRDLAVFRKNKGSLVACCG